MSFNKKFFSTAGIVASSPSGVEPTENFNTVLYTGNDSVNGPILDVGFQPDFIWIKSREDGTKTHRLHDIIRGQDRVLSSDTTGAETGAVNYVDFRYSATQARIITPSNGWNDLGKDYVSWHWKGGGAAVSNTDGDNNSAMVSANPDAGFSIITYTGDNANNSSVGHGLNQAPEMHIIKRRSSTSDWFIVHKDVNNYQGYLKFTTAASTNDTNMNAPTDSVIRFNTTSPTFNGSSQDWLIYAFHSVEGYQKLGSYTGTGATGNAVTTGFEPRFLMTKRVDSGGTDWHIWDSIRNPSNPLGDVLFPNEAYAEADYSAYPHNFLSNGFSIDTNNGAFNGLNGTYIYLAIA